MKNSRLLIEVLVKMMKEKIIKSFVGSRGGGAAHPPYIKVVPLHPKFYPGLYALGPRPLKI